jgi:hypothetical protein
VLPLPRARGGLILPINEPLELTALSLAGVLDVASMWGIARLRTREEEGVLLELLPPARADLDLREWALFYQGLFGIAAPLWRRALVGQPWISFELWGEDGRVVPRCWVPRRLEQLLRLHLATVVPGLEVIALDAPPELRGAGVRSRLRLWRDSLYPLGEPRSDALRTVVAALASAEQAVMQVVISPDTGWQRRALRQLDRELGGRPAGFMSGLLSDALDLVVPKSWGQTPELRREQPPSLRLQAPPPEKALQPSFSVEIRLRVVSDSRGSARATMHALVAAFRTLDGQNSLRPKRVWIGQRHDRAIRNHGRPAASMRLTAQELAHLYHLPVLSQHLSAAPVRIVPAHLGDPGGKVLFHAEDNERTPVRLAQAEQRHHIHITGKTGAGKTVLLHYLAHQDGSGARGCCVVDCKGDLIHDLLESLPDSCADRVILIDPSRRETPVGINVLDCESEEDRELVTDQSVSIFRKQFERFWGPRTDDLLRGALLTLLRHPGSTLCEVPLLLLEPEARARYTRGLSDPIGLEPLWNQYGRMSETQRLNAAGPVLNKLRSILMRPTVRNILGQSVSTIDLGQAMDEGFIVLIALPKGLLGEETSHLLAAFLVARIWQTAMARASRPEAWRPDFNLYLDEFQNYLHLPHSVDEILVEARGYHLSLTLAHQHLSQLPRSTRDALLGNAGTRLVFQCGDADARAMAHEFEPALSAHDLRDLGRFQVAARICFAGRTQAPVTGLTSPPPPKLRDSSALAQASLQRYGRPRAKVEAEILARLEAKGFKPTLDAST